MIQMSNYRGNESKRIYKMRSDNSDEFTRREMQKSRTRNRRQARALKAWAQGR